jgi:ATP-dependent DNA helicase RecQ
MPLGATVEKPARIKSPRTPPCHPQLYLASQALDNSKILASCEIPGTEILRSLMLEHFGFESFRNGQESVLRALPTSNVLAVMPTGGGKSMCFVLPGMVTGRTLIVSPLIALMQDQVESLSTLGVPAAFINSTLPRSEQNRNYLDFIQGRTKLLFVAPERFENQLFLDGLSKAGICLLAIDEAHCVSQWGHDFRPDYLRLSMVRERLGNPRTLALTATADPKVKSDIVRGLGLTESAIHVTTSVDRPNLKFTVLKGIGRDAGVTWLTEFLQKHKGESGIVYSRTRNGVDEAVEALTEAGLPVGGYHAGMDNKERADVQRRFMVDDLPVVIATNAFGMGVDKPDVRFVVHLNMPGCIEGYYQEAGRAGRDGEPAECVMLTTDQDEEGQQFFIDRAHPSSTDVQTMWHEMLSNPDAQLSAKLAGIKDQDGYASAVNALRRSGLIDDHGQLTSEDPSAAIDMTTIASHREFAEDRLRMMVGFVNTRACRRKLVMNYFGEEAPERCGNCDNCLSPRYVPLQAKAPSNRYAVPRGRIKSTSDQRLYEELVEWRKRRAAAEEIPAYSVCSPNTMREIAATRPMDTAALARVFGFGRSRIERFGEEVLDIVRAAGA